MTKEQKRNYNETRIRTRLHEIGLALADISDELNELSVESVDVDGWEDLSNAIYTAFVKTHSAYDLVKEAEETEVVDNVR